MSKELSRHSTETWPRFRRPSSFIVTIGQITLTELIFGFTLMAILWGVAMTCYESAIFKARFSEIMFNFPANRFALQEELALNGVAGSTEDWSVSPPQGARIRLAEGQGQSGFKYSVDRVDNTLLVGVQRDESEPTFFMSYTPAIIASGVSGSMRWVCGNKQVPAGWVRLPGPTGTDLPEQYLPSVCRD